MEITGKNSSISLEAYIKNVRDKKKIENPTKQASKANGLLKEDEVVLSEKAREIKEAKKLLDSVPEIREEKVAQLRKQIENGTYEVKGKEIAVKMVKESLLDELL